MTTLQEYHTPFDFDNQNFAVEYAHCGLSVIPLKPRNKQPLIPWEPYKQRIATPQEVIHWGKKYPNCNWAIVTGAVSGIVVLDLDNEQAVEVAKKRGIPPSTPVVRTGKGWHLYFMHPGYPIANTVQVFPGADIRGDGGYIVAPPSIHPSGHIYRWANGRSILEIDPTQMPKWLQELITSPKPSQIKDDATWLVSSDLERIALGVSDGERNQAAARLAGYLFSRRNMNPRIALALLEAWNLTNKPPLPLFELHQVVNSIARRQAMKEAGR